MARRGRVLDNWERLVRAANQREQQLRTNGASTGAGVATGIAGTAPASFGGHGADIDRILQAADEIEVEDPNVARILCEQAYTMVRNLDPSSEGRGFLLFKTGLMSVIKSKLAKKAASINRQHDIEDLWRFYSNYKRRRGVEDMQRQQQAWRESGTFTTNIGEMQARAGQMKKAFSTLRALLDVLEFLVGDSTDYQSLQILDEVRKIKRSDEALNGEVLPYNIVPLDAPSFSNN